MKTRLVLGAFQGLILSGLLIAGLWADPTFRWW